MIFYVATADWAFRKNPPQFTSFESWSDLVKSIKLDECIKANRTRKTDWLSDVHWKVKASKARKDIAYRIISAILYHEQDGITRKAAAQKFRNKSGVMIPFSGNNEGIAFSTESSKHAIELVLADRARYEAEQAATYAAVGAKRDKMVANGAKTIAKHGDKNVYVSVLQDYDYRGMDESCHVKIKASDIQKMLEDYAGDREDQVEADCARLFGGKSFYHSMTDVLCDDNLNVISKLYGKKGLFSTSGEIGYIAFSVNSKLEAKKAVEKSVVQQECDW